MAHFHTDADEEVYFWSAGLECVADLYLQKTPGPHPALIMGHGWNQTKQGLRSEGRILREAGYNVMIIDYRTMGKSPGTPRGQIFPRRQVEDLRNAITCFSRREDVDAERIGIYGVSFAGGLAIQTAAMDRRLKICISQSPIVNGREWMRILRNAYDYDKLLDRLQANFEDAYGKEIGASKRILHYGDDAVALPGNRRPDPVPFDPGNPNSCAYPKECQEFFNEEISFESVARTIDFNPSDVIDMIAPRPLLIIGNAGGPYDWIHPPEAIQSAFEKAGQPKDLKFLPYDAYGFYQEPGRSAAMEVILPWLKRHL